MTAKDERPAGGAVGARARLLANVLWLAVTLSLPVLLVLTGVRLVMTEAFLRFEYHRPGFPDDRFGFSREERLHYAPFAVQYLRTDAGINHLGDLSFPNGEALFRAKELEHMEDVKEVTRVALGVHSVLTAGLFAAALAALVWPSVRYPVRRGLADGGLLTLALIVALVLTMLLNWDLFFGGFHRIFFEGDSWQFRTSDTLIRLFPEQFWLDAAVVIGIFTVVGALLAVGAARWWGRRSSEHGRAAA